MCFGAQAFVFSASICVNLRINALFRFTAARAHSVQSLPPLMEPQSKSPVHSALPGAAGNLATEDLVYTLDGMGVESGVDLEKLWLAGQVAEAVVGRTLPGKVHQAGVRTLRV